MRSYSYKVYAAICLIAGLMLTLSGCGRGLPQAREMDDMALMRTIGVDAGEQSGLLTVTVSSSRRSRGIQGEEEAPLILRSERPSISGACLAMQGLSDSYVFYGHVDQLLLGEKLARQGVLETLEHFSQDKELGLGTQAWLIRGETAGAAIQAGKETGVDNRLSSLQADGEMGAAGLSRTVGEVLSDLLEDGGAYLPALQLSQNEQGDTALLEYGYGVLRSGALVGWLTGEGARGLELAEERPGADLLEFEEATVRVDTAALTCTPLITDGILQGLELDLRLTAQVEEEHQEGVDRGELREKLQEREQKRLLLALEQLQQWNTDCLGLARTAGAAQPEYWGLICQQWQERFPMLELQVKCTATLIGAGR